MLCENVDAVAAHFRRIRLIYMYIYILIVKDDVELTEEEFDALIEACEALADDEEKRQDEPELEEVCRELAKMLVRYVSSFFSRLT